MTEDPMSHRIPVKSSLIPAMAATLMLLSTLSVWLSPAPSMGMWMMLTLPLAMLMKGLRENRPRALQWLGFMALFYFTIGVLQMFSDSQLFRILGVLTTVCCLSLFVAAIVTLRRQKLPAPQQSPAEEEQQA
jgi:uncharacterized membrane protein